MTHAWALIQDLLDALSCGLTRLTSLLWPRKRLHTDRFATASEVKRLAHTTPSGLVLGRDRSGRILTVAATNERPHLGHLAIFGPTGSGKTTREEEQLRRWKRSAIVNDPKFQLSNATADDRRALGTVYFFSPSEGTGHTWDPLEGMESERQIFNLAKHLLYVPNEKEPAFTERATKMLTQLFLAAKRAWKLGKTDLRPLPYVAWLLNLGGLNDVAREVNAVSPVLAQKLLQAKYHPEKDYEQNPFRISSWDSLAVRLYPLLTDDVLRCFNGSDIKIKDFLFSKDPITLYLRWHESDLKALAPLIKFVWEAIIGELITAYDLAPDQSACQDVLLAIEEAGRTGIPDLPEHASTLRSRNISITAVFQDRSQGIALYGRDRATSLFNNFRYQVYYRQDDLETALYLEKRCGSTSGFAHSKTEHEGSVSTGESEQRIALLSAQYIMYDMPDDEILGFWGKRPFLGKRIPRRRAPEPEPAEETAPSVPPEFSTFPEQAPAQVPVSWRQDQSLLRHSRQDA